MRFEKNGCGLKEEFTYLFRVERAGSVAGEGRSIANKNGLQFRRPFYWEWVV